MLGDQVEALHVDEQPAIVGRAGRLEHAHDLERIVLVGVGRDAVRGLELVADFQAGLAGDGRADHRAEIIVGLEVAPLGEFVLLAAVVQVVEQVGRGADDAKLVVHVAQADRDRRVDDTA